MAKNQTVDTSAKAAGTTQKTKEKSLTKVNATNLEKVVKNLSPGEAALVKLKYVYPADCDTKDKRKTFRQKARKQLVKLEKAIAKAKEETKKVKAEKALAKFQKETYTV
jgi:hypothetical protein